MKTLVTLALTITVAITGAAVTPKPGVTPLGGGGYCCIFQ